MCIRDRDWEADAAGPRATVAAVERATVRVDSPTAWDDIRRAAPRAAAREAAVQAARQARRRLPATSVLLAVGAVLATVAITVAVMWPRKAVLAVSRHQSKYARDELDNDLIVLRARTDCADGG